MDNILTFSKVDKKLIHMISFSNFIDSYWNDNEKEFNNLINQNGYKLTTHLENIQSQRDIFHILNIDELKQIIKDLYLRRSLFIHKSKETAPKKAKNTNQIFYKIFYFLLSKSDFHEKEIQEFISKYSDFLSSIVFLRFEEKSIFFDNMQNKYENFLVNSLIHFDHDRYLSIDREPLNWFNQYFTNKHNASENPGRRYESFLLNYCHKYEEIIKNSKIDATFTNYFLHKTTRIKENETFTLKKRHYNNSLVMTFYQYSKLKKAGKKKVVILDYRIFLMYELISRFHKKSKEEVNRDLMKILYHTIELIKGKKNNNIYLSILDFFSIIFTKQEMNELKSIKAILNKWFDDKHKIYKNKEKNDFVRKNFIKAFVFLKLNIGHDFSQFLKKYKDVNFNEFILYFFLKKEQETDNKTNNSISELWLSYLVERGNEIEFTNTYLNAELRRVIKINRDKTIIVYGNTLDFLKYYQFIKNKKHLLRIAKNNNIKNNNKYSVKFIFNEIQKIIFLKLFNQIDNMQIVNEYEKLREQNRGTVDNLVHTYRNYIAHFGRGNETLFYSYKDYVYKKWKVRTTLKLIV